VWLNFNVLMLCIFFPMYRLTALFLAAKTTNNPISLDDYTSHIPKTVPADVLDLEFLVAQSLGFEFAVWHAHRALWGIRLDMEVRCFVARIFLGNTLRREWYPRLCQIYQQGSLISFMRMR
jgi:hypothetical protein